MATEKAPKEPKHTSANQDAPKAKRTVDRSIEGKLAKRQAEDKALIDRVLARKSKAMQAKAEAEATMLQCDADLRNLGYAGQTPRAFEIADAK